jgi:signal transduction histidine kinase
MPQGGTITVQTMMHGGHAVLAVEDEGRGIPADIRDRIYDPFFTTKAEGTGLGLSVVKRLVEEHRGAIRCEERYGGGTRFEVSLPVGGPPGREVPVNGPPPVAKAQTA